MDFGLHNINVKATAQMHEAFMKGKIFVDPSFLMDDGLHNIHICFKATAQMHEASLFFWPFPSMNVGLYDINA